MGWKKIVEFVVFIFLLGVAYIELDIPILSDVQSKELQLIYDTDTEDTIKFTLKWCIFFIILIVGIIRFIIIQYNNKVDKIQIEKDDLEQRLNEETKDLYNKFFELIEYKDRNNIKYSMSEYLQLEPFVLGVQLYTYKLKHRIVFNTVRPKRIMELKINHLESVVAEQEDLNAVVQSYDKINFWLYKELQKVTEKNDLESYNKFIQKYSKKLKKQMDSRSCVLQEKSAENCNEKYRVLPPNIPPIFSTMRLLNGSSGPCTK